MTRYNIQCDIEKVERFKLLLMKYRGGDDSVRSEINQILPVVREITIRCRTCHFVDIMPPLATGGYALRHQDPFDLIFSTPYGMNDWVLEVLLDSMDKTIGVLKMGENSMIYKKLNIKRLLISIAVLVLCGLVAFIFIKWEPVVALVNKTVLTIAGLGGLWGFISLVLNIIRTFRK